MIDLRHLKGKRYAVMGLAKSGLATAKALTSAGVDILAWDDGENGRAAATDAGIALTDLNTADLTGIDALLLSPGIPHTYPTPNAVAARAKAGNAAAENAVAVGEMAESFALRAEAVIDGRD